MRICNMCYQKNGDIKPSTQILKFGAYEEFDLCESCYNKVKEFMEKKEVKKRGRKKVAKKKL